LDDLLIRRDTGIAIQSELNHGTTLSLGQ
jgi:hypothetical protein